MDRMNSLERVGQGAKCFAQGRECPYIGHQLHVLPPGNGLYADADGLSELFLGKSLLLSPVLHSSTNFH